MSLKTLLKDSGAYQSCLKCHSASYKTVQSNPWESRKDLPTPKTASDPVSCSACHRHDSGIEGNLLVTADKMCTTCHILFCGG
jgi:predicted CXXCH cytochrome family protein